MTKKKKNDRKDISTANTAEMLPLTFAQKKKSNGTSRTRKWPRQISTKKKKVEGSQGTISDGFAILCTTLAVTHQKKKKKLRSSILCGMPNTASSVLSLLKHCSEAHSSAERDAQVVHNYRRSIATRDLYNRDRFPFFHLFVFLFVSIIKLVKQFRNDPSHSLF